MLRRSSSPSSPASASAVSSILSFVIVASSAAWVACDDGEVLRAPVSDKNFDDADEPATPGPVGAVDASTVDAEVACASDVDCPPRAPRCFFRESEGCSAKGLCVSYVEPAGCSRLRYCACNGGGGVTACAPAGFAPIPVAPGAICPEVPDAGEDAPIDAPPG